VMMDKDKDVKVYKKHFLDSGLILH
jgi:hypothetical protein